MFHRILSVKTEHGIYFIFLIGADIMKQAKHKDILFFLFCVIICAFQHFHQNISNTFTMVHKTWVQMTE